MRLLVLKMGERNDMYIACRLHDNRTHACFDSSCVLWDRKYFISDKERTEKLWWMRASERIENRFLKNPQKPNLDSKLYTELDRKFHEKNTRKYCQWNWEGAPLLHHLLVNVSVRMHLFNHLTTKQNTTLDLNQLHLVTLWMHGLGDRGIEDSSEMSNLENEVDVRS